MTGHYPWLQVSELISAETGLHFPPERYVDLRRGLNAAARELELADADECARWLLSAHRKHEQMQVLIGHLTVGETYFFRDGGAFEALADKVLPGLVRDRIHDRNIRIWSAGCCTGEEAYSIAILLREHLPEWRDWRITLLGTDINERFLEKAAAAEYTQWSFRDDSHRIQQRYFRQLASGSFVLLPEIRRMVQFAPLNLATDDFASSLCETQQMDIIFCRNVLMYFTADQACRVIGKFRSALKDEGWLIVSAAEGSHTMFEAFSPCPVPGGALYRKDGRVPAGVVDRVHFASSDIDAPSAPWASPDSPWPVSAERRHRSISLMARSGAGSMPFRHADLATRARDLADRGRLREALACCNQWIEAARFEPTARYLQAIVLQELRQYPQARQALQHAVLLDPNFVLAHFALGNLARAEGDARCAGRHFGCALRLLETRDPDGTLPESGGLTASCLRQIFTAMQTVEART